MNFYNSGYSKSVCGSHKNFSNAVGKISDFLAKLKEEIGFDAIAFRGNSGASVAWPVYYKTGIPILFVRKETSSHAHYDLEAFPESIIQKYVILDDFIGGGDTMCSVLHSINKERDEFNSRFYGDRSLYAECECVGIVVYDQISSSQPLKYGDGKEFNGIPIFWPK